MSSLSSGRKFLGDIVFIDALNLSVNVGPDCWHRTRPQPVGISVYLQLQDLYLTAAGQSDDVLDSVHYGHLSKAVTSFIEEKAGTSFGSVDTLISAVAQRAFALAGTAAIAVRVVVELPKMILLAGGFSVDVIIPRDTAGSVSSRKTVSVRDLVTPVIIGVNPPEREAKQRVITNIVFYEFPGDHRPIDYPSIVSKLSKDIESSSYLTLEKFVFELVRTACLSSEGLEAVTVRAQKPSALSFAQSSGVEITRQRSVFVCERSV